MKIELDIRDTNEQDVESPILTAIKKLKTLEPETDKRIEPVMHWTPHSLILYKTTSQGTDRMPNNTSIFEWADDLKKLVLAKSQLEELVNDFIRDIDDADWHLSNLMDENKLESFTLEGTTFRLTTTYRVSMSAGCRDDLFKVLREHGHGELIHETIRADSLSAFVKEQIQQNSGKLPEWLDGLVNVFEKTTVCVSDAKGGQHDWRD